MLEKGGLPECAFRGDSDNEEARRLSATGPGSFVSATQEMRSWVVSLNTCMRDRSGMNRTSEPRWVPLRA